MWLSIGPRSLTRGARAKMDRDQLVDHVGIHVAFESQPQLDPESTRPLASWRASRHRMLLGWLRLRPLVPLKRNIKDRTQILRCLEFHCSPSSRYNVRRGPDGDLSKIQPPKPGLPRQTCVLTPSTHREA